MLVLGLFLVPSVAVLAGPTTTQTVTYEVQVITEISVSGNPGALTIDSATAGSAPNSETDNTTTYAITANKAGTTITGEINTDMPANTTLTVSLAAPTGGSTAGAKSLSTVATLLATCVAPVAEAGNSITYVFSATVAAGVVPSDSKTVTLTVVP